MNKKWHPQPVTPDQIEQTQRVQRALVNEINLLAKEGVPVACILTGLGVTIADLITCQAEPSAIAPWFEQQAALVRTLQGEAKNLN